MRSSSAQKICSLAAPFSYSHPFFATHFQTSVNTPELQGRLCARQIRKPLLEESVQLCRVSCSRSALSCSILDHSGTMKCSSISFLRHDFVPPSSQMASTVKSLLLLMLRLSCNSRQTTKFHSKKLGRCALVLTIMLHEVCLLQKNATKLSWRTKTCSQLLPWWSQMKKAFRCVDVCRMEEDKMRQ